MRLIIADSISIKIKIKEYYKHLYDKLDNPGKIDTFLEKQYIKSETR